MIKKIALAALLLLLVAGGALFFLLRRAAPEAPNLLLITLDTTRADRIGAYGYAAALTPHLDRLAREGVCFENCYACVPLTLPAHSSLFTGRYPIAHNVRNNGSYFLNEGEQTLAEILRAGGYDTRAVVASFVLLSKFGVNQGFALYDDSLDSHEMIRNYKSEISAEQVHRKFSSWLGEGDGGPFFYWLHFYDPHTPYQAHEEFAKRFPTDSAGRYDGEIAYTDIWVGRVIADLQRRGLLERTLVVVAGDHGEAFGEHGEHGHSIFCYEQNLKVPLIFYAPRLLPDPRRVRDRVGLIDIMPTVLELLGKAVPAAVQGRSLRPLLAGGSEKERRSYYFESMYGREDMNWAPLTGLLHGGYKYISLPEAELYDLAADPAERANLFQRKNLVARDLDKRLAKFVASHTQRGGETRRELSAGDKEELEALGYISSFSGRAALTLDPKRGVVIDTRLKEISRMISQKQVAEAEAYLRRVLADNPGLKMPLIYHIKYKIFTAKRDLNAALNILKEACEEFPDAEQFTQALALALFEIKAYDRAERRCREILEKNPRSTRVMILLGEIREKQGRLAEAAEFFAQARDIEPQNVSLRIKYAELLINLKQFEKAVSEYDLLLANEEASSQPELLLKVALLNTRYGSMANAEQLLARAAAIRPAGKYFFNYALVLAKNGKQYEALASMETALGRHGQELTAEQRRIAEQAVAAWR